MTREQLRCFIIQGINNEQEMLHFVACAGGQVAPRDECLIINTAIVSPSSLWTLSSVKQAVRNNAYKNNKIGAFLKLWTLEKSDGESAKELRGLLEGVLNMTRLPNCFRVFVRLHRRGIISAKELLLPRLGSFSQIDLWETAITTFRICDPGLLLDERTMFIPKTRSRRFRALLEILQADATSESEERTLLLTTGLTNFRKLGTRDHSIMANRISHFCMFENNKLALDVYRNMLKFGDKRDLELIQIVCGS